MGLQREMAESLGYGWEGRKGSVESSREGSILSCIAEAYSDWADRGRKVDPFDTEVNSVSQVPLPLPPSPFPFPSLHRSWAQIDRVSRILFPATFALISTAYWITYMRKDFQW